jgi:hypothetical protein
VFLHSVSGHVLRRASRGDFATRRLRDAAHSVSAKRRYGAVATGADVDTCTRGPRASAAIAWSASRALRVL